jgi:hypothetical protein
MLKKGQVVICCGAVNFLLQLRHIEKELAAFMKLTNKHCAMIFRYID